MQTKKLALLSTMLIGLGGAAALAQQTTTDPALPADQTETLEQTPDTTGDTLGDAPAEGGIAEDIDPMAPEQDTAQEPGTVSPSVGTAAEPYTGTVLGDITADELIGMNVVDAAGENVGSISDLLINADNQVDRAIIDVGGFLGFGAKPVALEVDRMTVAEGDGEVVVDVTRDELEAMPEWQQDDTGWFTE